MRGLNKEYIDATVDYYFVTTNDRQIVKSFLYRTKLNETPRTVGKWLGLSQNQVNNLNAARLFRLSDAEKYSDFVENYKEAVRTIEKQWVNKTLNREIKRLRGLENRLKLKLDIINAKF